MTPSQTFYLLARGCLYAILQQGAAELVANTLVFETRAKASQLCISNGWDDHQLPVLTLALGLRFRELPGIQDSLSLLRDDQEMEAIAMITSFLRTGTAQCSAFGAGAETFGADTKSWLDRTFASRLLDVALRFATALVEKRVRALRARPEARWKKLT